MFKHIFCSQNIHNNIKVYRRPVRVKIFIMAVNPLYRYSNEAERANRDIYEDFKLGKTLRFPWFIQNNSAFKGLNEHDNLTKATVQIRECICWLCKKNTACHKKNLFS